MTLLRRIAAAVFACIPVAGVVGRTVVQVTLVTTRCGSPPSAMADPTRARCRGPPH